MPDPLPVQLCSHLQPWPSIIDYIRVRVGIRVRRCLRISVRVRVMVMDRPVGNS